jgi:DNA-binding NarL/FixJ family response regulator
LLGLSVNTVRNRVASAFKRMGASRRAELVYLLSSAS